MDRNTRERLISLISWGHVVTNAPMGDGSTRRFVLRSANSEDKALAGIVYEEALQEARLRDMMTEEEALTHHAQTGRWTEKDEQQLAGLRDDIHKMKRGLLDYLFQVDQLERIRTMIRRAEAVLTERWLARALLLQETAESYALMVQQRYIIGRVTLTSAGKPYWTCEEEFNDCQDTELIEHLSNYYFGEARIEESRIRELARTEPWRGMWAIGKHTGRVFPGHPDDWSAAQMDLARWSSIYDVAYESMDRPSEQVIADNDLMDSWLIRQSEKINEQTKKRETENLIAPKFRRDKGRQEIFVMCDAQGARRVYEMNDARSRQIIHSQQQRIAEQGLVKDAEFTHSQQEMREIAMGMQKQAINRGR